MTPATTTKRNHFRIHQGPTPTGIASALFAKLVAEWTQINDDPATTKAIQRFGKQHPDIAGYHTPGEIVDAIDAADKEATEDMLAALLRLFQDGHQLAGRILLQQFLPLVASITQAPRAGADTHWIEDRRHIAIAEFWHLAGTIDIDYYCGHLIGGLAWMLRRRFTKLANEDERQIPIENITDIIDTTTDCDDEPTRSDHYRLYDILTWAYGAGIISQADCEILTTVYIDGKRMVQLAEEMDVKVTAIRQRCHRATQRIRNHIDQIPAPAAIA